MKVNGSVVGETELNSKVASQFGVPAIFISGDDAYVKEVQETLPDVEAAVVKYGIDRFAAELISPVKTQQSIEEKAEASVKRINSFSVEKMETPVTFDLLFQRITASLNDDNHSFC